MPQQAVLAVRRSFARVPCLTRKSGFCCLLPTSDVVWRLCTTSLNLTLLLQIVQYGPSFWDMCSPSTPPTHTHTHTGMPRIRNTTLRATLWIWILPWLLHSWILTWPPHPWILTWPPHPWILPGPHTPGSSPGPRTPGSSPGPRTPGCSPGSSLGSCSPATPRVE